MMRTLDMLDRTTDEIAVRDVLVRIVAAWDANDADALAELYTCDASVVSAGSYMDGRDEIGADMTAGFAGPLKGTTCVEEPEQIRFIADDVAIVNTRSGYIAPGDNAVQPGLQHRATWVLTRTGSDWFVASYHNCAARQD